jgi:uncharacterized protein (DUF924 family)
MTDWTSAILAFWFDELTPAQWFMRDDAVDAAIRDRFAGVYERLAACAPAELARDAESCLAAIIALDQFPRNMFRGEPRAFATDEQARRLTAIALDQGWDRGQPVRRAVVYYIPLEHSEDLADQIRCCELMAALGDPTYLDYAERHKAVIERFGRFPHRNAVLGRESTAAEIAFLTEPGSGF